MVWVLRRIVFKLHLFSPMSWNSTFEPRSYCAPYLEIHRRSIQLYLYTKTFWKIETANAIFPEGFAIYNTIFLSGKITVWSLKGGGGGGGIFYNGGKKEGGGGIELR